MQITWTSTKPLVWTLAGAGLAVLACATLLHFWPLENSARSKVAGSPAPVIGGNGTSRPMRTNVHTQPTAPHAQSVQKLANAESAATDEGPNSDFAFLLRRAKDGDQGAANKLFHEVRLCRWYADLPENARAALRTKPALRTAESVAQLRDRYLARLSAGLAAEVPEACAGATHDDLETYLYAATLAAAQAGNVVAQGCYVNGQFGISLNSNRADALWHQYRKYATTFMQAGIRRGDWRMAQAMQYAYEPPGRFQLLPWVRALTRPDPVKAYTYMYLLLTHAQASDEEMANRYAALAMTRQEYGLSTDAITQAEAAANDLYAKYFAGRPQTPMALTPCPPPTPGHDVTRARP